MLNKLKLEMLSTIGTNFDIFFTSRAKLMDLMKSAMRFIALKKPKIFRPIVFFVSIFMVNNFSRIKRTVNH